MRKLGCGCLVVLLAVVGLLFVVGTQNQPASQAPDKPALPSVDTTDNQAVKTGTPPVEMHPPSIDDLRAAYAPVVKILKQLDALAKRPQPDQFVAVAKLHKELPPAMSQFDDLLERSPTPAALAIGEVAEQLLRWHEVTIPTDVSAEQAAATRKTSERMYLALLDSAPQWSAGPKGSPNVEYSAIADAQMQSKLQSIRLYAFTATLESLGLDNSIIESTKFSGDEVTITVAQAWHLVPYQFRLQAAQSLYALARQLIDNPRLILVDVNGNRVGGSGILDRNAIDVVK